MKSWPMPSIPAVPGRGRPLRLFDPSVGAPTPVETGSTVTLYVCGITPYDATHLGHAATYVTFDLLQRTLRDAGLDVDYVQNVTDVDEPLFERAARDGVSWEDLGTGEIALFREDMTALAVIPPTELVGVVESIPQIAADVRQLVESGAAYAVDVPDGSGQDVYLDLAGCADFGSESGWTREQMLDVFADRGGDPDRAGKRDPLDPLLWRAERPGEPSWPDDVLGAGRPGWHIECTSIAHNRLGVPFDIQGGGSDLVFPHHEMTSVQSTALTGRRPFARRFVHQAMVGLDGAKMSKSRGNLVLVSRLRAAGADPMAIRLVLLAHHYRTDWEYVDADLEAARERLGRWRAGVSVAAAPPAEETLAALRAALADDLDTPSALTVVDAWAERSLAGEGTEPTAAGVIGRALDALLGIRI